MSTRIRAVQAYEVLDSRGNPTVAARVTLESGATGEAFAPSGASTGRHEAAELRDGEAARYAGKGVLRAVGHARGELAAAVLGADATDQSSVDARLREADGTENKSRLGANAILAISCAAARAAANHMGVPLWHHMAAGRAASLPLPMVNILSGGLHAGYNVEFQDFLAIPHGFDSFAASIEAAAAVHRACRALLADQGYVLTGVADEGGWGPLLPSNEAALEVLTLAIERAGYQPREQVSIAIDVAASHFHRDGVYHLSSEKRVLTAGGMSELLDGWAGRFPVVSIEDALAEDDWEGWRTLTARIGARVQLIGDDFFTTNPQRVARGIAESAANAVLVKMNQIGTLTETFEVIDMARDAGFRAVISARSGETEDDFLAHLAIASGAGQIKVGSITRSERLAKYNRLLIIEQDGDLVFRGRELF